MVARAREQSDGMTLEQFGEVVAKLTARAHSDGSAAARATIDALNSTIDTMRVALESREMQITRLEEVIKAMLGEYGELVKANTQLAQVASKEKIAIKRLESDARWKAELVELLGPAAKPAMVALLKRAGLDLTAGDAKLLAGDGTPDGDGRAALWAVVLFIGGRTDLQDEIIRGVGPDTWQTAMGYLQAQQAAQQETPEVKTKANGIH